MFAQAESGARVIITGDSLVELKKLEANSIDSVVTDPPYGLSFMGKKWDYDVPTSDLWREVFRVLKPGGHLLSFGGTRTYHRLVCAIEDAGFEIRDQIQWLYGSGFPKSHDVSKGIDKQKGAKRKVLGTKDGGPNIKGNNFNNDDGTRNIQEITLPATIEATRWQGWGTALKPANEPICVARKPLEKGLTVAENVLKWGTGAINIDGCRIAAGEDHAKNCNRKGDNSKLTGNGQTLGYMRRIDVSANPQGRWPANVILDEEAAKVLDEQSGDIRSRHGTKEQGYTNGGTGSSWKFNDDKKGAGKKVVDVTQNGYLGGASRFFYCAKASKSERSKGLDGFDSCRIELDPCDENTELVTSLLKVTLESITNLNTEWSGNSILVKCQKECLSIIKMEIQQIIALKTWSLSTALLTKEYMKDAASKKTDGISLVQSAKSSNELTTKIGILLAKAGSATDAVRSATLAKLSKLSDSSAWKPENNTHPTVKPVRLMEYLIKLVTPPNGTVLDPFAGSGSTLVAAKNLNFKFVGIEMNPEYVEIIKGRVG